MILLMNSTVDMMVEG